MDEEFPPTIITREDIDKVMKQWEEDANKPSPITNCMSCNIEMSTALTDYYTGQCQECFHSRKPWLGSSPVRNSFLVDIDDK